MSIDYWEPWTPEVRDRVRVKASIECTAKAASGSYVDEHPNAAHNCFDLNGRDGIVEFLSYDSPNTQERDSMTGHNYTVKFDSSYSLPDGSKWWYASFAAIELELINE